jgi:hypothetical protein
MTAWLLSWNPKNWEWGTFFRDRATAASGQPVSETWRCANGTATKGDTVYLVRTGEEPRGVIARGMITQNPFEAPHYDPARSAEGEKIQVVGIKFDDIRDPTQDDFLSMQTLEDAVDRDQTWNPQSSGIAINNAAAEQLERRWSQLRKPNIKSIGVISSEDVRVLGKYEHAAQGAWVTMPEEDKKAYFRIHSVLQQILASTFEALPVEFSLDKCSTLGFSTSGGVRGNRPKDLWCAIFPRGAEAYMPQVYLIISHRGAELGYAAAIHPSDFSNQEFKRKLKQLAPRIFDALPDPTSTDVHQLSEKLIQQAGWYFRQKTRLQPNENDFGRLEDLISFLKSPDGKSWGAGVIARYWLPHQLTPDVDLAAAFFSAASMFKPLLVQVDQETASPPLGPKIRPATSPESDSNIRAALEQFMEMYPEKRSKPFGTDQELWAVISQLQQRLSGLHAVASRPAVRVTWSVGQGNWARVPWVSLIDTRVTDTTQQGIYGVFLFREDMSGVYLTLNQGVTEPKKTHGAAAGLQLLREQASSLRTDCGELARSGFNLDSEIDLRTEGTLGRDYEAAAIAYKLYERGSIPNDDDISRDIDALLIVYTRLIDHQENVPTPPIDVRPLPVAPPYTMENALSDLFLDRPELDELLALWRTKKNIILQGAPGVGKTFTARRLACLLMGHRDQERIRMIQFHQAYTYEDFIQGYRPSDEGGFVRRDGHFHYFAKLAEADSDRPYVFIIDEINRGNLSKVLGELMMLIEPDKRGEEYALPLTYGRPGEKPFSVPSNLFLLGLMNTADRSLAMVDYALRRRFAFHVLEPQFKSVKFRAYLSSRNVHSDLIEIIIGRMTELNAEISSDTVRLGTGYQIGHSFFVPTDNTQVLDRAWYRRVIQSEISPLLREYWFDNQEKADRWQAKLLDGLV